jgi:diacylglycerol kinase (ATP)
MNAHWFFVINPVSGKGAGLKLWEKIQPLLLSAEIDFGFAISEYHTHAIQLVAEVHKAGIRNFIGIGGDGTINEMVNGICENQRTATEDLCTINLLPVGTGNDWVRGQREKLSVQNLVARIQKNKTEIKNLGCVALKYPPQKRYFINVAGAGIDGRVVQEIQHLSDAGEKGKMVYVQGLLKALFNFSPVEIALQVDRAEIFSTESYTAIAAIGKYFGGGMIINPEANSAQASLNFTIVKSAKKLKILAHLPKLFTGKIKSAPFVSALKGNQLQLKTNLKIPVQADGEWLGEADEISFSLLPKAIKILV